ncbi:hypothetical protein Q1695_003617 [Nippostrongylus brasiliensis]|nr:hypothetical protein Q1695_003617 [Nippostrongylus brasiliensis]
MLDGVKVTTPFAGFLMAVGLVGIVTHHASACHHMRRLVRRSENYGSQEGPQLARHRGELPDKVVLAAAGDSLLEVNVQK